MVEFKKAGTAALFFIAACCFYFYSSCLFVIRYVLLRFFSWDTVSHITVLFRDQCCQFGTQCAFLASHRQNTPKDEKWERKKQDRCCSIFVLPNILSLYSFSKPNSKDWFSCRIRISPYYLGVETLFLDFFSIICENCYWVPKQAVCEKHILHLVREHESPYTSLKLRNVLDLLQTWNASNFYGKEG